MNTAQFNKTIETLTHEPFSADRITLHTNSGTTLHVLTETIKVDNYGLIEAWREDTNIVFFLAVDSISHISA